MVQEEPVNSGAWTYLQPRLETAMRETQHHANKRVYVAGREPVASVATGSKKQHALEIQQVRPSPLVLITKWRDTNLRNRQFLDQAFDLTKHAQTHGGQEAH
jgi:2-oxoglutarate dehydrogenase E1 component